MLAQSGLLQPSQTPPHSHSHIHHRHNDYQHHNHYRYHLASTLSPKTPPLSHSHIHHRQNHHHHHNCKRNQHHNRYRHHLVSTLLQSHPLTIVNIIISRILHIPTIWSYGIYDKGWDCENGTFPPLRMVKIKRWCAKLMGSLDDQITIHFAESTAAHNYVHITFWHAQTKSTSSEV